MVSDISINPPVYGDDPLDDLNAPIFTNDRAIAILNINGIKIPLSKDRMDQLIEEIEGFKNKIFCYKCNEFIMSRSGWNYGGSCKLKGLEYGVEITESNAGYSCCVDCMDSCKKATPKKTEV